MGLGGMSLEDIWRLHRRFIVAVAGGAIVFLVGLSIVAKVEAAAAAVAKENRRTSGEIEEVAEELVGREPFEAGMADTLAHTIGPATRAAVEFTPRAEFVLGEADSPFLAYQRVRERVQGARRADLLRRNISCPEDLGLNLQPAEDRVKEAIAVADLADRVLGALLETGVRQIEVFRPGEPEYLAIGGAEDAPEAKAEEAPVLRRLPLRFAALAPLADIQGLLARFQRSGACLELAAARIQRAGGPAGAGPQDAGLLRVEVEVAALTLVPAAEARLSGPKAGAAPARRGLAPRGGGRR
jgi:hypothetical protein